MFKVLQRDPERIHSVVAGKRAEQLLDAWNADYQRRFERASRSGEKPAENSTQAEITFSGEDADANAEEGDQGGPGDGKGTEDPSGQAKDNGQDQQKGSKGASPPKRRTRRGGRGRRQ